MGRRIGEQGVYLLDPKTGRNDFLAPGTEVTDEQAARLGRHVFDDFDPDDPQQLAAATGGAGTPPAPAEPEVRVVVSPIPGDVAGYEALTIPDLKAIADARGVEVASSANKPDIIETLLDVDEQLWSELAALTPPAPAPVDDGGQQQPAAGADGGGGGTSAPAPAAAPKKTVPAKAPGA